MKKKFCSGIKFSVAFLFSALFSSSFSGPLPEMALPQAESNSKIEDGKRLYKQYCEVCHGVNMNSGSSGAFDLRGFPANQQRRFIASVANGKNSMPPWRGVLSTSDIESLFSYVTSQGNK